MLEAFWEEVAKEQGQVVTWNGTWDLRFIIIRSMVHGLTPTLPAATIRAWFRKYATFPHFDCRAVVTNWEPYKAGEGLNEWSRFFGIDGKAEGMSGADVYPLYLLGHFAEIEQYCAQDVAATKAVYAKLAPMFASEAAA
jgi:predicted PolB exonuclease-like 3'-5' exonuclease